MLVGRQLHFIENCSFGFNVIHKEKYISPLNSDFFLFSAAAENGNESQKTLQRRERKTFNLRT
jgi:hypothetical protein